jgi:hypothetical protein
MLESITVQCTQLISNSEHEHNVRSLAAELLLTIAGRTSHVW